jgi:hypothetical protein
MLPARLKKSYMELEVIPMSGVDRQKRGQSRMQAESIKRYQVVLQNSVVEQVTTITGCRNKGGLLLSPAFTKMLAAISFYQKMAKADNLSVNRQIKPLHRDDARSIISCQASNKSLSQAQTGREGLLSHHGAAFSS